MDEGGNGHDATNARHSDQSDASVPPFELTLPVCVVAEQRPPRHRWGTVRLVPVAVALGHAAQEEGAVLVAGDTVSRVHAGNVGLRIHRKETEGVLANLASPEPVLYVVMRPDPDAPLGARVHLVTASDHEAQDHADAGEDEVERVALPPEIHAPVAQFVEHHHAPEPFHKRKRRRERPDEHKFGQRPIFEPGSRPEGAETRERGGEGRDGMGEWTKHGVGHEDAERVKNGEPSGER